MPLIGLTGRAGAGKDTVCDRLMAGSEDRVCRASFAAPLKRSLAALFDISVEDVEKWKRSSYPFCDAARLGGRRLGGRLFTMRELLQRYGTEAHRDVFGPDFWVKMGMAQAEPALSAGSLVVFTDVRFDNEVAAIHLRGGTVAEVVGPEGPMLADAHHASERRPNGIDMHIYNEVRDDGYEALDHELEAILMAVGA